MVGEKIEIECRVRYSIKYDNRLIDWFGVVEKIHDRRVGNKFFIYWQTTVRCSINPFSHTYYYGIMVIGYTRVYCTGRHFQAPGFFFSIFFRILQPKL